MKKILLAVSVLLFSLQTTAAGFSDYSKIGHIYHVGAWTMMTLVSNDENPDGCDSLVYVSLKNNHSNYKAIYAAMLAAHLQDRKVKVWLSGCDGQFGSYPNFTALQIH